MSLDTDLQYLKSMGFEVDDVPAGPETAARDELDAAFSKGMYKRSYDRAFGKETDAEKGLEGAVFKFGFGDMTLETEIPIDNKDLVAGLVGVGDLMGDSFRGIAQWIKAEDGFLSIDEDIQDDNENILRQLYDSDKYGAAAMTGAVVGAVAEPIGLLLPVGKFKSVTQALMYTAGVGALYGSSMYVDGDESRLTNAALGAAIGGAAGAMVQKFFRQAVGGEMDDLIRNAAKEEGISLVYKGVDSKTGKPRFSGIDLVRDTADQIEVRASLQGKRHSILLKSKNIVDQVLQPIVDNVKKYSQKVGAGLQRVDFEHHSMAKGWADRTKGFSTWMNHLPLEARELLHKNLTRGIDQQTLRIVQKLGGQEAVTNMKEVGKVLDEILTKYQEVGYKINPIEGYFPRSVHDLDMLIKHRANELETVLQKAAKNKGSDLSQKETDSAIEHFLTKEVRRSNTSGSLRKRKLTAVKDELLPAYRDPVTTLFYYINSASEDIAMRQFFKGFGHKAGKGGLDVTGSDVVKSIDSLMVNIRGEKLGLDDTKELVELLKSRFSDKIHRTHGAISALRNMSQAYTLGNFWSAVVQLGDPLFGLHKYGIPATVKAILGPKMIDKERLGITKAMIEMDSGRSAAARIANWAYKYGGFDMMDTFGKNLNLNSALRANRTMAMKNPEKFKKKWGAYFKLEGQPGMQEIDKVIRDLSHLKMKKGEDLSDNVRFLLWSELADTQPIGLSEMPKKYLDMANGRILYTYKTFTLKQMNYMRKIAMNPDQNPVQRGANLAYFAGLFVVGNATVDMFKDFMSGEFKPDFEDKLIDNMISVLGTSKYAVDKSKGLGSIVLEGVLPVPITQAFAGIDKISRGDVTFGDIVNLLPIGGKINREYEFIE